MWRESILVSISYYYAHKFTIGIESFYCTITKFDKFYQKSCRVSRECIPDNKQCDGENDCEDESDEENCEGQFSF